MGAFLQTSIMADPVAQTALSMTVERESQWAKKSSTAVKCQAMFSKLGETCFLPTPQKCYNFKASRRL